jgi:fatty acid desaturase
MTAVDFGGIRMATSMNEHATKSLQDEEFKEQLQELRRTDNVTNLVFLASVYLYLLAVIGAAVLFFQCREAWGLAFAWNVPVTVLAIVMVGAGQHQLTGLAHEASHHILFRNRLLNELASDWLCMFPLFSTTYHYRLQHLAHHQFVNDPDRDPDVAQLRASGHWLNFPLLRRQFFGALLSQMWIPRLIKYMRIRATFNAMPTAHSPYMRRGHKVSKLTVRVGIAYILGLIVLLTGLVRLGDPLLLGVGPILAWLAIECFYGLVPARFYHQSRIVPVVSSRAMTMMRMSFITALFTSLAWITLQTGAWAALYFFLLWVVPIFTSFALFMVMRQFVQHGNGGRGWLTNTRVFLVKRLIRLSVFPMGQDLHLPHHMYASVPHYRLQRLHELLLNYPEYREQAVVVEGYFVSSVQPPERPTVADVVGPAYAPAQGHAIHIDDTVLDSDRLED